MPPEDREVGVRPFGGLAARPLEMPMGIAAVGHFQPASRRAFSQSRDIPAMRPLIEPADKEDHKVRRPVFSVHLTRAGRGHKLL